VSAFDRRGALGISRLHRVVGSVVATTAARAVLTFDDGPDPAQTLPMLEVLRTHDATATFFVLMTRVSRYPHLLQEVVAAGHEIALHGPDHQPLTRFTFRQARDRTAAARADLEDCVGRPVRWFRPPYGRQTPSTWLATRQAGLTPVLWSGTTWDWKDVPQADRLSKAAWSGRPGAIVLAHDGIAGPNDGAQDPPAPLAERAALMNSVLEEYTSRGLCGCSLSAAVREAELTFAPRFTIRSQGGGASARPVR
jgi:peptidoglycan/xylan/chitin deacetylase (PgdA/CDA1 family)